MHKRLLAPLLILCGFSLVYSQNMEKQIRSLENDFKQFKYRRVIEKGNFLLSDAYTSHNDSLRIYQYMLSSAYAISDTVQAKAIVEHILRTDPRFSLNPKSTSPKIIEFYEYVRKKTLQRQKRNHAQKQQNPKAVLVFPPLKPQFALASVLLPGSGHYLAGFKSKGAVFSSVSALWLTGAVYAVYVTNNKRNAYLAADRGADFNNLYNAYNQAYKTRNFLLIGYGLWNLYCLYDLNKSNTLKVNLTLRQNTLSLNINKSW